MSVPFHKQTDVTKQPGQIVLCSCGDWYKHQCPGEWEPGCDLGANEAHVVSAPAATVAAVEWNFGDPLTIAPSPHKLSFKEWYTQNPPGRFQDMSSFEEYMKLVWNAGQENK